MDRIFTPENLISLFQAIDLEGLDLILVGGQAINIWASYYVDRVPALSEYLPFASADLDFYGGKIEAIACQKILGGTINLNRDFDPSPNTGVLIVPTELQPLRIDFLSSVFGIGDIELSQSAIVFEGDQNLAGIRIKILNPMLCLEGKIKSAVGLPQNGRQDLKHLQMSLLFVKEYVKEVVESDVRKGLKLIERIAFNIWSDAGLKLWYLYGIDVSSAIPTSIDINTVDPKWNTFQTIRLPQINDETVKRRGKYSEIQLRIKNILGLTVDLNE
jgi:hypothetical protein